MAWVLIIKNRGSYCLGLLKESIQGIPSADLPLLISPDSQQEIIKPNNPSLWLNKKKNTHTMHKPNPSFTKNSHQLLRP